MMSLYDWLLCEDICNYYRTMLDRFQEPQFQTISSLLARLVVELIQAEIIWSYRTIVSLLMLENKRYNLLYSYEYGMLKCFCCSEDNSCTSTENC